MRHQRTDYRMDMNVTILTLNCIIDDLDKQNKNPIKKTICGLKFLFGMGDFYYEDDACGTVACLWGGGFMKANKGYFTSCGPSADWIKQSAVHKKLDRLFYCTNFSNEQVVAAYRAIDKKTGKLDPAKIVIDPFDKQDIIEALG